MLMHDGQITDLTTSLPDVVSSFIDNDMYQQVKTLFLTKANTDRYLDDALCQAEQVLCASLSKNSGFIRPMQAFRWLGFLGNTQPKRHFKDTNEDGQSIRRLADGSTVVWDERPNDVFEDDFTDGKKFGWTINDYIENVLPWARAMQTDRLYDDNSPFELKPISVAVMGPKGGSYKTATTIHFSIMAALLGFRVLVIDGDPQATLSTLLGYPMAQHPVTHPKSLSSALDAFVENEEEFDSSDFIRPSIFKNVSIITGSTEGSMIDMHLYKDLDLLDRFNAAIKATNEYDLIITDTRPQSTFQDFSQYHAADILLTTVPANTTGIGSVLQGLTNYTNYKVNIRDIGGIEDQKNQLAILCPTGVDSDSRDSSLTVYEKLLQMSNTGVSPLLVAKSYIPRNKAISEAASMYQTIFQKAEVDGKSSSTKGIFAAITTQFEEFFEKALIPFYLKVSGEEVSSDDVFQVTGNLDDPLNKVGSEYSYMDAGFAWLITRSAESATNTMMLRGKEVEQLNPKRYLRASDLGMGSGHQIVMSNGKYYALDYDLDQVSAMTPYVLRHNTAS